MALDFDQYKCEICGAPCTQVLFATFLCSKKECEDVARDNRGGPGGHMARKAAGKSIDPESIIREDQIINASSKDDPKND
ncbi:MAG: hypothetical protein MJZ38_04750 [archaeon]|nr:hypothetical protein [archaeon]